MASCLYCSFESSGPEEAISRHTFCTQTPRFKPYTHTHKKYRFKQAQFTLKLVRFPETSFNTLAQADSSQHHKAQPKILELKAREIDMCELEGSLLGEPRTIKVNARLCKRQLNARQGIHTSNLHPSSLRHCI